MSCFTARCLMRRWNRFEKFNSKRLNVAIVLTIILMVLYVLCPYIYISDDASGYDRYKSSEDFENFDNVSGTHGYYIVPNIVHFIRFGQKEMTFIEAVCVLAALKNQKPKILVIHTDHVNQQGKYWDVVVNHPLARGVMRIRYRPEPATIFGQKFNPIFRPVHTADVIRLEVLMEEGGIYLDGDSYIVRNLDEFRKFEMTLGWQTGGGISNQAMIAHKHARFLKLWYDSYMDYKENAWFYNAGDKPTEILKYNQHLIHRVPALFAEYKPVTSLMTMIYLRRADEWTNHYVIHLMINHQYLIPRNSTFNATYPVIFNEDNIFQYNAAIKDMALAVYPSQMQEI